MRVEWGARYKHIILTVTDAETAKPVSVVITARDALQLFYRLWRRFFEQESPKVGESRK
jgi:hypothetical protein